MECEGVPNNHGGAKILTFFFRFRWVFCQLETLQHCFPQSVRQFLGELPESLDKTYEGILRVIHKAKRAPAFRLLQCLAVAVRPLRVEELAEVLAVDFDASARRETPKLKVDWRWGNQEDAILSTCSSLLTVVKDGDTQVVQFSHFSVKEYLTSPRLAHSDVDISRFHVRPEPAHTILAQACLGTLLRLDGVNNGGTARFPLTGYAARHWVDHAQFEKVSSRIRDGLDDLFDVSKPYFAAWLRIHDMDRDWTHFSASGSQNPGSSPLYYAAFCGLYDLVERLITKYPGQLHVVVGGRVQAVVGGRMLAPLPAALYRRHFRVADLLHQHGAAVDIRGSWGKAPIHAASMYGLTDIVRWLLDHNADANDPQDGDGWTPLHLAACNNQLETAQVLLDYDADVNSRTHLNESPLSLAVRSHADVDFDLVQFLLEHGAEVNARGLGKQPSLHVTSFKGQLDVARLLLKYGANVDEKDDDGMTPFQIASVRGYSDITTLLSEHGARPET
jgi:ankyrin repeat protein